MFNRIKWKKDGWTSLQEANPAKHVQEINCRCEDGKVVEVRLRHSRGEEVVAEVTLNGQPALPMPAKEFKKHFDKDELVIK